MRIFQSHWLYFAFYAYVISQLFYPLDTQARRQYASDVPYVPTPQFVVNKMLEVAQVDQNDYLIDLGSGDGRVVITAAKTHGAKALGIELKKDLVSKSRDKAKRKGVEHRVNFKNKNLFETNLRKANVVTMYLLPEVNLRLRSRLLNQLKPGSRVVSHAFDMGHWEPDKKMTIKGNQIYYWVIPADVRGEWMLSSQMKNKQIHLHLEQSYQEVQGVTHFKNKKFPVKKGTLKGKQIQFTIALPSEKKHFIGKILHGKMKGYFKSNPENQWVGVKQ